MAVLFAHHLRYDFSRPRGTAQTTCTSSSPRAMPRPCCMRSTRRPARSMTKSFSTFREFGSRLQGHPSAGNPLGRRRNWLARPGPAHLRRHRARRRPSRILRPPGVGALRRLRDGRGVDVGGVRARRVRAPRQPRRGRRRQPSRPAGPDPCTEVGYVLPCGARQRPAAGRCKEIDGHDLAAIDAALQLRALEADAPAAIFARTKKGSGVAAVEDKPNWHGKHACRSGRRDRRARRSPLALRWLVQAPPAPPPFEIARQPVKRPAYELGAEVATRAAYGDGLAWLGSVDEPGRGA